jgi:type II secretory pathway pseudopilin PulG
MTRTRSESGFSLIELLIATGLLLMVSGIVTSALMHMMKSEITIWNRTEMHSGIRGATELLQQEVGQAGRIGVPGVLDPLTAIDTRLKMTAAVNAVGGAAPAAVATCDAVNPAVSAVTVPVSSSVGIFASAAPAAYMLLTTLDGDAKETIKVAVVSAGPPATIQACFTRAHVLGTILMPLGGFATGIIPPAPGMINGSSATVLKMYGDINDDGNMVYIEYTCDAAVRHNLYRNMITDLTLPKTAETASQILLSNVRANPGATDCFTYQTVTLPVLGTNYTFVLDVAVTLTVETEQIDPVTRQKQTETKALLNVSPRNVFNAWMLAGMGYTDRVQSTPATITALLPALP